MFAIENYRALAQFAASTLAARKPLKVLYGFWCGRMPLDLKCDDAMCYVRCAWVKAQHSLRRARMCNPQRCEDNDGDDDETVNKRAGKHTHAHTHTANVQWREHVRFMGAPTRSGWFTFEYSWRRADLLMGCCNLCILTCIHRIHTAQN